MIHFRRVALALSAMVLMCLVVASESGAARSSAIGQTAAARVLTRPRRARAKQLTQSRKPRSGRSDVSGRESGALGRAGLPSSSKAARTRAAPVETERVASKGGAEEAPRSLDQSQPANARVGAGSDQGDVNLRRSGRKRGGVCAEHAAQKQGPGGAQAPPSKEEKRASSKVTGAETRSRVRGIAPASRPRSQNARAKLASAPGGKRAAGGAGGAGEQGEGAGAQGMRGAETRERSFWAQWRALLRFRMDHGHCSVPFRAAGRLRALGHFVHNARSRLRRGDSLYSHDGDNKIVSLPPSPATGTTSCYAGPYHFIDLILGISGEW